MTPSDLSTTSPIPNLGILRGAFRILFFYDVAEALDPEKLRQLLGDRLLHAESTFPRRTPDHVRFEQAPVTERAECVPLKSGEQAECSIRYYAFAGVVVLQLELQFLCDWGTLISKTARWIDPAEIEPEARAIVGRHLEQVQPAVIKPTQDWLHEEYLVINIQETGEGGGRMTAAELLSSLGPQLAQLVRGELVPLADKTIEEILQGSISYYWTDLVVVGSLAALVYDRCEDAAPTVQVLEYAKLQLLEFRYYDTLMSRVLAHVYSTLEHKKNILFLRWSSPREAQRFNTLRLDVMELTERIDNAIKFVSDIYYAHLHRLAASRTGVNEYRDLVEDKLRTAGELYEFMVDQFNEARSFILEVGIGILALVDIILLLRGK